MAVVARPERSEWVVLEGDAVVGRLAYRREGDVLDAYTTWVDPAKRGGGVALELVAALLDFARAEGLRVRPTCWYVAKVMRATAGAEALLA